MAHYRQTIRDATAAVLAGRTGAGQNVFTSRARPVLEILQRREMVLSVYTADEASDRSGDGHQLVRRLTVSIEGMAGGGDDLDDVLDSLCAEVEALIDADPMLGNLLSEELVLVGTTSEISARGNQQVGAFKLDYECGYRTARIIDTSVAPPLPTLVSANGFPVADFYDPIGPDLDITASPSQPVEPAQSACGEGGCDLPAWGGDQ